MAKILCPKSNVVGKFETICDDVFESFISGMDNDEAALLKDNFYNHSEDFLPIRSTVGSAGYDFKVFTNYSIPAHSELTIPTFIKCKIKSGWFLAICPRSGMGFKFGVHLANTIGIIDSDYYGNVSNDGHIMCKLINPSDEDIILKAGDKFCQGIFIPYGVILDEDELDQRIGGFGSTGK